MAEWINKVFWANGGQLHTHTGNVKYILLHREMESLKEGNGLLLINNQDNGLCVYLSAAKGYKQLE